MNQLEQALWLIENHKFEDFGLCDLADRLGVSKFHLSRSFSVATGKAVERYIRVRRLTEAAKMLAHQSPNVLSIALDVGYSSHEAFTRAFSKEFGVTPTAFRNGNVNVDNKFQEPIIMKIDNNYPLAQPRIEHSNAMTIAGVNRIYDWEDKIEIPGQWGQLMQHSDLVLHWPCQSFGVAHNLDLEGGFEYLTGFEKHHLSEVTGEFFSLNIPSHKCAVFRHQGNVSLLVNTWNAIFTRWVTDSGMELKETAQWESYSKDFDQMTGEGTIDIWIPIEG